MARKNTQNGFISIAAAIIALLVIGGGIMLYNTSVPVSAPTLEEEAKSPVVTVPAEKETAGKAGSYETYAPEKLAKAENGKVVLFFHASWCSTCRVLEADIRANLGAIPENVTILDVDYDASDALKKKYKVTTQHTLVQVDAKGEQIKQWKGSPTLADMLAQIQ